MTSPRPSNIVENEEHHVRRDEDHNNSWWGPTMTPIQFTLTSALMTTSSKSPPVQGYVVANGLEYGKSFETTLKHSRMPFSTPFLKQSTTKHQECDRALSTPLLADAKVEYVAHEDKKTTISSSRSIVIDRYEELHNDAPGGFVGKRARSNTADWAGKYTGNVDEECYGLPQSSQGRNTDDHRIVTKKMRPYAPVDSNHFFSDQADGTVKQTKTLEKATGFETKKFGTLALHKACRKKGNNAMIAQILADDPASAGKAVRLNCKACAKYGRPGICKKKEVHSFPINLALKYHAADSVVLEALMKAAPDVLTSVDGYYRHTPLHVALRYLPSESAVVDAMLLTRPDCVKIKDGKYNTPLHSACLYGACITSIRHLVILYPEALLERDFHGRTPLQVAQCNTSRCTDDVAEYLMGCMQNLHGQKNYN